MNGSKSHNPAGDDRTSNPMRTWCGMPESLFPSPLPSPLGRGSFAARCLANLELLDPTSRGERFSLSFGKRAGVRGNRASNVPDNRSSAIVSRTSLRRFPCLVLAFSIVMSAWAGAAAPVRIIFDTDIGNDVDDVLALSVLHAFQTRGECELLAVTITKPDELAGPFVDAVNTFYGRPNIPIGFTHAGLKNEPSKFLPLAETKDGRKLRYPHRLKRSSDAPEATALLRQVLSRQPDRSVVLVQVGYFSNFAALLDTPGDAW